MILACIGGHPFCDALGDAANAAAVGGFIAAFAAAIVGALVGRRRGLNPSGLAQTYAFWGGIASSFVVGLIVLGLGLTEAQPKTKS
jgi:hypothetical protein